jgi:hypothetical protein
MAAIAIAIVAPVSSSPALAQAPPARGDTGGPTPSNDPAKKEPTSPAGRSGVPAASTPAAKPFAFSFALKGFVSAMMYAQDATFLLDNGNAAFLGPSKTNKWFLGGDVRQTQLKFMVKGPGVLSATPTGVVEIDFLGGNGMALGAAAATSANTGSTSPFGDESVLPSLRLAYVDLDWGAGADILRVGQVYNLLLPMIPASAGHIGFPLGYGAGALGWREPGITYFHKIDLSNDTRLDLALQVNRNSWIDNEPTCSPTQAPGPTPNGTDCLPAGVSMGEASALPQVEARAMFASGKSESPWPYYPPGDWVVYLVGHWDEKLISGVGPSLHAPARDSLQTYAGEFGIKVQLGPLMIAGNGWYGLNTGGLFGNVLQMQPPTVAAAGHDVAGFGAWGQFGVSFTEQLTIWGFYGVDQPNAAEAEAAGFTRLRNMQMAGMLSYKDGPYAIAVEFLHVLTDSYLPPTPTTPRSTFSVDGNQPSVSAIYFF